MTENLIPLNPPLKSNQVSSYERYSGGTKKGVKQNIITVFLAKHESKEGVKFLFITVQGATPSARKARAVELLNEGKGSETQDSYKVFR